MDQTQDLSTARRAPERPESGQLALGVAHELNNLLTTIIGHVTLLLEDSMLSPTAREDLAQIQQAADRAVGLARRLQGVAPASLAEHAPAGPAAGALRGDETILVVDDEAPVRELARRILQRAGYAVITAADAESAAALADRHAGPIHLLLTDVMLPRVSGRELAARLGIHRPAIRVLYVSGTTDRSIARHRMLEPGTEFLKKPFRLEPLLRKVRQVLGAPTAGIRPA